jgi:ABC-type polysaccharide/polyol phosphate export permease
VVATRLLILDGHGAHGWRANSWRLAWRDLRDGASLWRLWTALAWGDIRQRYRRSVIGPFWITLSMAILVGAQSLLYGVLLHVPLHDYLPFLTVGYLIWGFISSVIGDAGLCFAAAASFLRQSRLPKSLFVYRMIWRNLLMVAHNAVVYFAVALIFDIHIGHWALTLPLALAILALNGVWVGLLVGMAATRFRDVPQIITNFMQVAFFITPILFKPEMLGQYHYLVDFNPLTHFIGIARAPLLGEAPALTSWLVVIAITIAGCSGTMVAFVRLRARIAYWI